jgi:hypothetical protein
MNKLILTVVLSLLCGGFYPVCGADDSGDKLLRLAMLDYRQQDIQGDAGVLKDVKQIYQLCKDYKSWQERADESAIQIKELNEILKTTEDHVEKAELREELENQKKLFSGLKENITGGLMAAYGETRNLFPQFKADIEKTSIYNPDAYDPESAKMLAEARRLIAEVRSVNSAVYHADGSNAANPIDKRVWQDTASAVEHTGKTLSLGLTNFFIRQEGKGRQKPNYLKNAEPVLTLGPFLKRGKGGDVPEGNQTYIDFYSLKKPQTNQYASVSY